MIPRELIRKVRKIEIVTRHHVQDQMAGAYHSIFKGAGIAFEEVRPYQVGDDIRLIDWNVSARMNDVFVKLFVEEREMTVILLVDVSGSLGFGSTSITKNEVAAEIAALLSFSAIENNDRVGLIMFSDRIEKFIPPKKGRKHVLRVVVELLGARPRGRGTDINVALDYLGNVAKRKAVVFLMSDFQATGWEHALRLVARRHDLIPIEIFDPRERHPLPAGSSEDGGERGLVPMGLVLVEDPETGEAVWLDTDSPQVREAFTQAARREELDRHEFFRRNKIDFISVDASRPYLDPLVRFFRLRERRVRRL
jgi:uncharacterized protein (DUF58 family)